MTTGLGAAFIEKYRDHPADFAAEILRCPLREWQPDFAAMVGTSPRIALKTCRAAGKTHLLATLMLWYHLTRPLSVVAACAPVWQQLGHLWTTLSRLWQTSPLPGLLRGWSLQQDQLVSPIAGWKIQGLSAESGERIEGLHSPPEAGVAVFFDEARGVDDSIYDRLVQLVAGHTDYRIIAASTPGLPRGFFYRAFSTDADRWRSMTVSAADIPRLREHFEQERVERGEDDPFFLSQSAAQFSAPSEGDSVFDFEAVRLATERPRFEWSMFERPWPNICALDPAGRGKDHAALAHRRGPNLLAVYDLGAGSDEMQLLGRVVLLLGKLNAQRCVVDIGGLGGPMESRLREVFADRYRKRVAIEAFNSSWAPENPERFANVKAETMWRFRSRLHARGGEAASSITLPKDSVLTSQLCAYTWQTDSRGRIRVVDPTPSPDKGDAAAMTFFRPRSSIATFDV